MSMTDPIADMLTRLRNAIGARHRRVDMPSSKIKVQVARILKESSYITDYRVIDTEEGRKVLRVILKYAAGGQPVIRELKRISTPGLRKYVGVTEIPRVRNGLGMAIVSRARG
jgi:small subunit ribosomal protein S8